MTCNGSKMKNSPSSSEGEELIKNETIFLSLSPDRTQFRYCWPWWQAGLFLRIFCSSLYGLTSPFFAEAWLGDRLMMGRVLNLRGIQFLFFICHILKTTLISQKGSPNRVEESLEETIVKTIFHTTYFGCALTRWIITANYKTSKTCLGWACIFNFGKT